MSGPLNLSTEAEAEALLLQIMPASEVYKLRTMSDLCSALTDTVGVPMAYSTYRKIKCQAERDEDKPPVAARICGRDFGRLPATLVWLAQRKRASKATA